MQKDTNSNGSKLFQAILELRKELAEEEITPKGYNNKIDRLLADADTDTKIRFEELEQSFNDGDIDSVEYEKRLAAMFPQDGTLMHKR